MPYNTTAIPPRSEATGQAQLPVSRVKRIIGHDPDVAQCSTNAAFVITIATELFIQHLTEESHNQAKLERKPRRNIQYKDVAAAVSRQDNLEFLQDVVPKTTPYWKAKTQANDAARARNAKEARPVSSHSAIKANGNGTVDEDSAVALGMYPRAAALADEADDPNEQLETEMRQAAGAHRDGDVHMSG